MACGLKKSAGLMLEETHLSCSIISFWPTTISTAIHFTLMSPSAHEVAAVSAAKDRAITSIVAKETTAEKVEKIRQYKKGGKKSFG